MFNRASNVFIAALKAERSAYDDGLYQIFLLCAPLPPTITAKMIRNSPKSIMALVSIFLMIKIIRQDPKNYTFDNEALDVIDSEFD